MLRGWGHLSTGATWWLTAFASLLGFCCLLIFFCLPPPPSLLNCLFLQVLFAFALCDSLPHPTGEGSKWATSYGLSCWLGWTHHRKLKVFSCIQLSNILYIELWNCLTCVKFIFLWSCTDRSSKLMRNLNVRFNSSLIFFMIFLLSVSNDL